MDDPAVSSVAGIGPGVCVAAASAVAEVTITPRRQDLERGE